jgi:hypothetical protein
VSKLLLSTPFSPITRIPAEENISLSKWQSVACVKKKRKTKSCSYLSVTGAMHMGTKTDAARKWRNERTFDILFQNSPLIICYIYFGLIIFLDFDHCLKFVPVEVIKACRMRRDMAPHILNLGTRWRRQHTVTPRPLYLQRQNPQYPSNRRTFGPQNRSGDFAARQQNAFRKLDLFPSSDERVDRPLLT